jgi:hypothetical protein
MREESIGGSVDEKVEKIEVVDVVAKDNEGDKLMRAATEIKSRVLRN